MHARRLARPWLAALLGAATLGSLVPACRPKPEAGPIQPTQPAPPVVAATPVTPTTPKVVATATAPAQLLPESTVIAATVASVRHLLRVVDYPSLIAKYRTQYDQAVQFVEGSTGFNLLDPAKWTEIGVNPDGPLGFAMFDLDAGAGCAFFTLSDAQRFREFVDRLGTKLGGQVFPVYEDRGVVLATDAGASTGLVLRDGFAFFVFVDRPARAPYDYARELASVDPARGLVTSARWQKAVGAAPPRDVLAFVDVAGMIRAESEQRRKWAENPEPTWAETELQRLREQGAPAEEITRWEQIAAEQKTAEAEMRARRAREQEFMAALFGPLGPLVFELSLSDKAVQGTIRAQAPDSALVRKVTVPRDAPPLAITAAGERVVLGAGVSVDVAEALLAVDAALKADGESLEKLFEEIRRKLTIDPRAALGSLDGTVSFALTLKDPLALASDKGGQSLGLHVALGLKAPAEAQALVDVAALKLPPGAKVKRNAKTRGFSLPVPDWREVHVAVVGKTLAVTTDPEFLRRVERGAAGALDRVLPTPTVPVVTTRDAVGVFFMDYLMPMGLLASRRSDYAYDPSTNQPYWRFPEVAHEKIDKVPHSAAYKAKLKEWRALDAKARKAEEVRERAQTKVLLAVAGSIGALAVDLRETGDGLQLEGGQFFGPGGLARAIELGIDATAVRDNEPIWELYDKRSKAEQELQEVRARDVEKALGVQASQ